MKNKTNNNKEFLVVESKNSLRKAFESGSEKIIIKGKLAKEFDLTKKIIPLGSAAIGALVIGIASIPATAGLSMAVAAPVAAASGIGAEVVLAIIAVGGVSIILALYKNYDVKVTCRDAKGNAIEMELTKKQ